VGEATLTHLGTPADQRSHLVIEGGGHYAFDADPEGFNAAVLALIAELEAAQ
jgi:pimeloyl-ACP methyl ester carboxylesterase